MPLKILIIDVLILFIFSAFRQETDYEQGALFFVRSFVGRIEHGCDGLDPGGEDVLLPDLFVEMCSFD